MKKVYNISANKYYQIRLKHGLKRTGIVLPFFFAIFLYKFIILGIYRDVKNKFRQIPKFIKPAQTQQLNFVENNESRPRRAAERNNMGNTSDNSKLAHIAGCYYCSFDRKTIGAVVFMNKEDGDTIIGYNCDYQTCGSDYCQLKRDYPIGTSDREATRKLDERKP